MHESTSLSSSLPQRSLKHQTTSLVSQFCRRCQSSETSWRQHSEAPLARSHFLLWIRASSGQARRCIGSLQEIRNQHDPLPLLAQAVEGVRSCWIRRKLGPPNAVAIVGIVVEPPWRSRACLHSYTLRGRGRGRFERMLSK